MSEQAEARLAFRRKEAGIIPWTLLGFIVLSLCVHAFAFFVFQTIYPPAGRASPPPVQVGLLMPGTPEADAILRWINTEDPALTAEPTKAPIPGLTSVPYVPSYTTARGKPTMPEAPDEPLPKPDAASGLELVRMAIASPAPAAPQAVEAGTTLDFGGPLRGRAAEPLPALDGLHESELGELQSARFMVGVSGSGTVEYTFLQRSSGDRPLDAAAEELLKEVRFNVTEPTWGFASFHWGPRVFAQPEPAQTEERR